MPICYFFKIVTEVCALLRYRMKMCNSIKQTSASDHGPPDMRSTARKNIADLDGSSENEAPIEGTFSIP